MMEGTTDPWSLRINPARPILRSAKWMSRAARVGQRQRQGGFATSLLPLPKNGRPL